MAGLPHIVNGRCFSQILGVSTVFPSRRCYPKLSWLSCSWFVTVVVAAVANVVGVVVDASVIAVAVVAVVVAVVVVVVVVVAVVVAAVVVVVVVVVAVVAHVDPVKPWQWHLTKLHCCCRCHRC